MSKSCKLLLGEHLYRAWFGNGLIHSPLLKSQAHHIKGNLLNKIKSRFRWE